MKRQSAAGRHNPAIASLKTAIANRQSKIRVTLAILLNLPSAALAHPVPFTYIDVRVQPPVVELSIVAHVFDIGNDLAVQPPEKLLDAPTLTVRGRDITQLLSGRLGVSADGEALTDITWSAPEALPDRQSIRIRARHDLGRPAGRLDIVAEMFPYDPQHRTFLNVYENGDVTAQAILDKDKTTFQYFTGTRQGIWAVIQKFVPSGVHHILIGPDHLMFLAGLLLLGGTMTTLVVVVSAFTLAHSITLSLAALGMVIPPANAIEPAIALSVVYVGADNLLVRAGGRDTRAWVAFAFGLIHGFGFANVLREMDLPARALGWTLFSFNIGVEVGQLVVVVVVAALFARIRSHSEAAAQWLAVAGSVIVMLAGAFWFVQRVFFSGGTA